MTGPTLLAVALAGGLGAASRAALDGAVTRRRPGPAGVLVVNVVGSLLLGLLAGAELFHGLGEQWLTVGGTGFCGGFTTFSTVAVLVVQLERDEGPRRAAGYLLLTVAGTLLAATAGVLLASA